MYEVREPLPPGSVNLFVTLTFDDAHLNDLLTIRIGLFGYSLTVCVSATVDRFDIGSLVNMELSKAARTIMVSFSVLRLRLLTRLMVDTPVRI